LLLAFLLFVADIHYMFQPNRSSLGVQVGLTRWVLKGTATAAGYFSGWYCSAALHVVSFMVLLVEFFSCTSVWLFKMCSFAASDLIQEEIKRRLNLGNACYHSFQNISSSCLLSENIKI
jgi:hypothetical protein